MALPQEIPVRYTEEEAGYVSFRPVVRQTFRVHELLDMILSVTGKTAGAHPANPAFGHRRVSFLPLLVGGL